MKLSVNVDHIATLRQVRGGHDPNLMDAIEEVLGAGAHGITVHLRQDLRHIQPEDLMMIRSNFKIPLNIELAAHTNLNPLLEYIIPSMVTLVPEKPSEITTEGGLQIDDDPSSLKFAIRTLKERGVRSSLFVDPNPSIIQRAISLQPDAIEINTNLYSLQSLGTFRFFECLEEIKKSAGVIRGKGIKVLAGHGLNRHNVPAISTISDIEELNIGHSIVARSLYVGLSEAVKEIIAQLP